MGGKTTSRRKFIQLAAATSVAGGLASTVLAGRRVETLPRRTRPVAPAERVGLATIGMGIIGFIDTETALRVPGVEFVAAADCYDARLVRTKEVFGAQVETTRDYQEILARPDVDAVIISVPDHWHARMAIDALEAGKAVYLEKPMVQDLEEGPQVIEAQRRTGKPLQVGSQFASSIVYDKAKELYEAGAIGEINMVEARYNRNSSIGAWQYSIPPNVSEQHVAWDRFLGNAPERPFDPVRFFRWRNYWDYGTGVAGDLFVHLFTGIHHVLSAVGPTSVMGMGGLHFWKDGRDAPDVTLGLFDYPQTEGHAPFTLALQCNFEDAQANENSFRFVGNEGVITLGGGGLKLTRATRRPPSLEGLVEGYNSVRTWSEAVQQEFIAAYKEENPAAAVSPELDREETFEAPQGYDDRYDHFTYFFESVRSGKPVYEDPVFGYRAAAPALLSNMSLREKRLYQWDPEAMKVVS